MLAFGLFIIDKMCTADISNTVKYLQRTNIRVENSVVSDILYSQTKLQCTAACTVSPDCSTIAWNQRKYILGSRHIMATKSMLETISNRVISTNVTGSLFCCCLLTILLLIVSEYTIRVYVFVFLYTELYELYTPL